MYVLRKKSEEEDTMFGGVVRPKTNKRSKRDKRRAFVSTVDFLLPWLHLNLGENPLQLHKAMHNAHRKGPQN